jgi:hypothetical protein
MRKQAHVMLVKFALNHVVCITLYIRGDLITYTLYTRSDNCLLIVQPDTVYLLRLMQSCEKICLWMVMCAGHVRRDIRCVDIE